MPSSSLFDTLPASLFKPLTSPEADCYGRILIDLYREACRAAQPLRCDLALDIIISHTLTPTAADDPLPAAQETLRYLQDCGWLRVEIQPNFTQACTLTLPAFRLLQAIGADSASISELLIAICDLLKAALLDIDNNARLREAARLTDQLLLQLKAVQHNPGGIVPLPDTARLRLAVMDASSKLETRGHALARYIREQFQTLDRLLNDIVARHGQRLGADRPPSVVPMQLNAVLNHLATAEAPTLAQHLEALVNLYHLPPAQSPAPNASTESQSAQSPRPVFVPDSVPLPEPSLQEIEAARREVARQLNRPVSPDRVSRLARAFLENKPEVRAADLVSQGQADLPLLIQLRLLGDGGLGYKIEDLAWAEINGLVFRDFALRNPNYVAPPEAPPPLVEIMPLDAEQPDEATASADEIVEENGS